MIRWIVGCLGVVAIVSSQANAAPASVCASLFDGSKAESLSDFQMPSPFEGSDLDVVFATMIRDFAHVVSVTKQGGRRMREPEHFSVHEKRAAVQFFASLLVNRKSGFIFQKAKPVKGQHSLDLRDTPNMIVSSGDNPIFINGQTAEGRRILLEMHYSFETGKTEVVVSPKNFGLKMTKAEQKKVVVDEASRRDADETRLRDFKDLRYRILSYLTVVEALRTDRKTVGERKLLFLENDGGADVTPYYFTTNYPGRVSQMEQVSPPDRYGDLLLDFLGRLRQAGYTAQAVGRLPMGQQIPDDVEVVKGGLGEVSRSIKKNEESDQEGLQPTTYWRN